jgi:hypothetical protein
MAAGLAGVEMTKTTTGNIIFVAALGAVLGLLGNEVKGLQDWGQSITPSFIGTALMHLGTVIGAYVGGRLIPTSGQ